MTQKTLLPGGLTAHGVVGHTHGRQTFGTWTDTSLGPILPPGSSIILHLKLPSPALPPLYPSLFQCMSTCVCCRWGMCRCENVFALLQCPDPLALPHKAWDPKLIPYPPAHRKSLLCLWSPMEDVEETPRAGSSASTFKISVQESGPICPSKLNQEFLPRG